MSQHCKSARSLSFPVFLSSSQFIAAMFMTDAFLSSDASSSLSLLASLSLYLKAVVDAERRNLGSLSTASLELSHDALRRYLSVSVSVFRGSAVFVPPSSYFAAIYCGGCSTISPNQSKNRASKPSKNQGHNFPCLVILSID